MKVSLQNMIKAILMLIVFTLFVLGCASSGGVEPESQNKGRVGKPAQDVNSSDGGAETGENSFMEATVVKVVDGDTVHVSLKDGGEEKVRLIGVDTPESTRETEPYGREAAAYTRERLDDRKVWLEHDVEERDRYGRLLAYVWLQRPVGRDAGDPDIRAGMYNAELLLKGFAQVMTVPPNVKYVDYFLPYQTEAREGHRGLWGQTEREAGAMAERLYLASAQSNKFHRPDCKWGGQIKPANLVRFDTSDEALDAGYQPCRVCKP